MKNYRKNQNNKKKYKKSKYEEEIDEKKLLKSKIICLNEEDPSEALDFNRSMKNNLKKEEKKENKDKGKRQASPETRKTILKKRKRSCKLI